MNLLSIFWSLVIESAPWLLIGYLLAGIIKQVIPSEWVHKQMAEPGFVSIVKGAFIGAPLPLCSCGVIPTALAVRKAGASKGATSSFLVATPETGVDSISFSFAVLGPVFALARPIAALSSAIVAGLLVNSFDPEEEAIEPVKAESSCCHSEEQKESAREPGLGEKMISAVQYGYGRMISDTAKWLLIGLVAATLITAAVPQSFFLQWGDGLLAMIVMVLVGLPMYICATASTPVAAGLLFAGVSPGAALVFMLTGPATNIATMGVIREQLGTRSLIAYMVGVIVSAIVSGLTLNQLYGLYGWPLQLSLMEHGASYPLWRQLAAVLLCALLARVWLQPLFERRAELLEST
ncbi:MAG: SO_0444 family Cu/Zn efflux transporter [Gammaproteobacteria bacterium]|nr:SO_0444 family Cu/Zn efflux transporter [Gammaproteobacteria bacterium]MDG2338797.1 SO_0444 family Cu/Zn efflux transporter [Gammaproteobacteria bacterium]